LGGDFFRKQPAHPSVMKLFLGGATGSGSGKAFGVVDTDSVSGKLRIYDACILDLIRPLNFALNG